MPLGARGREQMVGSLTSLVEILRQGLRDFERGLRLKVTPGFVESPGQENIAHIGRLDLQPMAV